MFYNFFYGKYTKFLTYHNNYKLIIYYCYEIVLVAKGITNLKLHNLSITPKMVKKVILNLDSSKAPGPDCIPVLILKNCEPELSYILTELLNLSERVLFSRLLEGLIGGPCI